VINAYADPSVDNSLEEFSWGRPEFDLIRQLCAQLFGWESQLIDIYLNPLISLYNSKQEAQTKLTDYYKEAEPATCIKSERMKIAICGLTENKSD